MSNPSGGSRKSPTSMDTGSASQSPRNSGIDSSAAAAAVGTDSRSNATPKMALQISSDEINVLIYRYLQESGMSSKTMWAKGLKEFSSQSVMKIKSIRHILKFLSPLDLCNGSLISIMCSYICFTPENSAFSPSTYVHDSS